MNKLTNSKSEIIEKKQDVQVSVPNYVYSRGKSKTNPRVTYKNYFSTSKKVEYYIKRQDVRLIRKLKKQNIQVLDIKSIDKFHQKKYKDGILISDFFGYGVHLKNGNNLLFSFSKRYKTETQ